MTVAWTEEKEGVGGSTTTGYAVRRTYPSKVYRLRDIAWREGVLALPLDQAASKLKGSTTCTLELAQFPCYERAGVARVMIKSPTERLVRKLVPYECFAQRTG